MNILITGGAGFIGSHLCERLLKDDNNVYCIDNLSTGSMDTIEHLKAHERFTFIHADVTKDLPPHSLPDHIDYIYHLASPASPNHHSSISYHALPMETMMVNTVGTHAMLELAKKYNARFLFTSTSEIYGEPLEHPQKESYRCNVSTTGPRSVYDEAKRFGETIVAAFVRIKGLDARITRIFNTYGPRMNVLEGRAVVNFIKQSLKNAPLTIYGTGKQTRSFCFIDDQVEGQILAMDKGQSGEVFNIGNPDERSILEFATIIRELVSRKLEIKKLTKSKSEFEFLALPEDDPKQRMPDISKAFFVRS